MTCHVAHPRLQGQHVSLLAEVRTPRQLEVGFCICCHKGKTSHVLIVERGCAAQAGISARVSVSFVPSRSQGFQSWSEGQGF